MDIIKPKIIDTNEISTSQESERMGRIIDFCEEYSCLNILLPKSPNKKISGKNSGNGLILNYYHWKICRVRKTPGFYWVLLGFIVLLFCFYFSLYFPQF